MANHPNPDRNASMMQKDFGTKVLITDPSADKYLERAKREDPTQKKFTQFCGGKGGWSDYTEWWG